MENNISVEGNHYTALYGEYDTRLGKPWNEDPRPNPLISNYAILANNPIINSDLLLDSVVKQSSGNKGLTPISSNMFTNGGLVLTANTDARKVYYNLAKQFVGKWSLFNGYKFSSIGPIKIDENGTPIRVNSDKVTPVNGK
ncbi:MAG: hypothetical protein U0Y08_10240 [Bacteroidia bacterium]